MVDARPGGVNTFQLNVLSQAATMEKKDLASNCVFLTLLTKFIQSTGSCSAPMIDIPCLASGVGGSSTLSAFVADAWPVAVCRRPPISRSFACGVALCSAWFVFAARSNWAAGWLWVAADPTGFSVSAIKSLCRNRALMSNEALQGEAECRVYRRQPLPVDFAPTASGSRLPATVLD